MDKSAFPEEITKMLSEHPFGVLATYGGVYPYTSLISLAFSDDFRYLIFPTLRETRKYANLCQETKVSVLLDNRSLTGKGIVKLYAMTVLGNAHETDNAMFSVNHKLFLKRHPHLSEFLSLPQTALVQVTFEKLILVEEFQEIREFEISDK